MNVPGIAGWSSSGKTTLLTAVLPLLKAPGLHVSTIKHTHRDSDRDRPSRDSFRHRDAGAHEVLVVSGTRWSLPHEVEGPEPDPQAKLDAVDLVLVEGYKMQPFPELKVHRPSLAKPPLWTDMAENIVGDRGHEIAPRTLLPLNDAGVGGLDRDLLFTVPCEESLSSKPTTGKVRGDLHPPPNPYGEPSLMRLIAFLSLALTLSGCGYQTWGNLPFTGGSNPNQPVGDSETMLRVRGEEPEVARLTTEPGDIWPGPLPPAPTLKDLVDPEGLTPHPEMPVPGSPLSRGTGAPLLSPNPGVGSSVSPGNVQPGLTTPRPAPPLSSYAAPPAAPPARGPSGQIIQTPSGPAVTTGGGQGYQTTTTPSGGQSIIVPNGNGTNTVIHSDGRIETIPTAK
jgi:molybdopterin-guanine dinucleotide biosynthesis protein B